MARRHPSLSCNMVDNVLSVFVDESGNFGCQDQVSRFYVIGLVFHDQGVSIQPAVKDLDLVLRDMGIPHHYFHAGPLIRREKGYAFMDWGFRRRIFARMMAFSRSIDFKYACLIADKRFVNSSAQIGNILEAQLREFLQRNSSMFDSFSRLKVYYDCGQPEVTKILHRVLGEKMAGRVEFAQGVIPQNYKMFQIADLVCTAKLIEQKLKIGISMTESEIRFFGGHRDFKHNILRKLKPKEI